jgi:hypothetical protein
LSLTPRWAALRVARELDAIIAVCGQPVACVSDDGTELRRSTAGRKSAASTALHRTGKSQNAECLKEALFSRLPMRREALIERKTDYNTRPHALARNLAPAAYAKRSDPVMQRDGSLHNAPLHHRPSTAQMQSELSHRRMKEKSDVN